MPQALGRLPVTCVLAALNTCRESSEHDVTCLTQSAHCSGQVAGDLRVGCPEHLQTKQQNTKKQS
jgi:hypothetical protein